MKLRKIGLVAAMWVLGLVTIAAFTWGVHALEGQPVDVAAASEEVPTASASQEPLAALTAGAARSAVTARHHLADGTGSKASHALDAARHAADIGHENSHGSVKKAYAAALQRLDNARKALHNGRTASALAEVGHAVEQLTGAVEAAKAQSPGAPAPLVWHHYRSVPLVDATGAQIGEVHRIEPGPGGTPIAVLQIGGATDILGSSVDVDGRTERVSADRILWGPRRFPGSVSAALPVSSPDDVVGVG